MILTNVTSTFKNYYLNMQTAFVTAQYFLGGRRRALKIKIFSFLKVVTFIFNRKLYEHAYHLHFIPQETSKMSASNQDKWCWVSFFLKLICFL